MLLYVVESSTNRGLAIPLNLGPASLVPWCHHGVARALRSCDSTKTTLRIHISRLIAYLINIANLANEAHKILYRVLFYKRRAWLKVSRIDEIYKALGYDP